MQTLFTGVVVALAVAGAALAVEPFEAQPVDLEGQVVYSDAPAGERTEVVWVKRIWDKTRSGRPYHSWMMLNFFKGKCFVTICESLAGSHRDKQRSVCRLITSDDECRTWKSVFAYGDDKVGVGSTCPVVVPFMDGKLWLENNRKVYATQEVQQRAIVSNDGVSWGDPRPLTGLKQWPFGSYFMELKAHKGVLYGFQYRTGLMRSRNGFDFEKWPTVNMHHTAETGVGFLPTGEMVLFGFDGLISVSKPPYRDWAANTANMVTINRSTTFGHHFFCGPRLCVTPDGEVYASARSYGNRRGWQYTLWRLEGKQLEFMNGFRGTYYYVDVVWHDGFLYAVYSGAPRQGRQAALGNTAVYLAKINLPAVKKPLTDRPYPYFREPPERDPLKPRLLELKRIGEGAPHNGQTDLIRFRDKWICAYREAERRPWLYAASKDTATGGAGKVRVLLSDDAVTWRRAALLEDAGTDLVEPQLSVTPDGRVMLVAGGYRYAAEGKPRARVVSDQSRVAFSRDGKTWTALEPVGAKEVDEEIRLTRLAWHDGRAYAFTRMRRSDKRRPLNMPPPLLVSSADGVQYEIVNDHRKRRAVPVASEGRRRMAVCLAQSFGGDEAAVRFTGRGEMLVLAGTRPVGPLPSWPVLPAADWVAEIATSRPPYRQWDVHNINMHPLSTHLHSPNFIILPNGDKWVVLRDGTQRKTRLCRLNNDFLDPVLDLPSAGTDRYGADQGHPGIVWHDGVLWVSYHSGHESKKTGKQACIYLAKIRLPVE